MGNWNDAILTQYKPEKLNVDIDDFLNEKYELDGWYCTSLNEYFQYKWSDVLYGELKELSLLLNL